jgi:hypothetical protein
MRGVFKISWVILMAALAAACASAVPPARIGDYLSPEHRGSNEEFLSIDQQPLKAGLVVVSDMSAPGAAPNLPDEAFVRLGESLKQDIGRAIPVAITEMISAHTIKPQPNGDWAQFEDLGRQRGLDYLAVVVLSSTEQEYPVTLFLGRVTHAQPGFRRDNWSLLEFALLDLRNKRTLMEAEGRGWATLDWPTAPAINQWYPVVYLRPDESRMIWPPTYEGAPYTLRVVSFDQAGKRLELKLRNFWLLQLQAGAAAEKSN